MPRQKHEKPLYQRGKYRLIKREGRNHEIIWYDSAAKRERSKTAGSRDIRLAKEALDSLYLQRDRGQAVCPTCNRPWEDNRQFLLVQSMMDYDAARRGRASYAAIHYRLKHVHGYLAATDQLGVACEVIDEEWIEAFVEHQSDIPVVSPAGNTRERAPATINSSVAQLAACINFSYKRKDTLFPAAFRAKQPSEVNKTPSYRSGIHEISRMFAYALEMPERRRNLLNFLRISVATLIRPDHAHYIDVDQGQWNSSQRILDLLPRGQQQTKKRRPIVPIARQAAEWLDSERGQLIDAVSIKSSWNRMQDALDLPGEGQAGPKLIRRSMATLVRDRIDQRDMPELEMMLGHRPSSAVTDLYAPFDPSYLSRVRAAIESIIDDLEKRVPGTYHRSDTANGGNVVSIGVSKNA